MSLRDEVTFLFMVCNEEYWLELAMRPALATGLPVLVADCGSSDLTPVILSDLQSRHLQLKVYSFGLLTPEENGVIRGDVAKDAETRWVFAIDGDEIYTTEGIGKILSSNMGDSITGFSHTINIAIKDNRFYTASGTSHHAVHRRDAQWHGKYPFESTEDFRHEGSSQFLYFLGGPHAYHVRYLQRSSRDADTFMRVQKIDYFPNVPSDNEVDLFAEIGIPVYYNPYFEPHSRKVHGG